MPEFRRTFRPVSSGVCWQKQLRDAFDDGVCPPGDTTLARSVVRPISRALAAQVILKYEWLGTMAQTSRHYGLFFGPHCAGVACFGVNCCAGPQVPMLFALDHHQVVMLARGACVHWAPTGANSRLVSHACRLLARAMPTAKLVLAYSDVDAGEIGTIYQACNWTYVGAGASTPQWVTPSGARVYDNKLAGDIARTWRRSAHPTAQRREAVRKLYAAGWTNQPSTRKHRYVYILDRADAVLAARIDALRRPYPKRGRSIPADALAHPAREGGATPTRPLQHEQAS